MNRYTDPPAFLTAGFSILPASSELARRARKAMLRSIVAIAVASGFAMPAHATVNVVGTLTVYTTEAEFAAALKALGETAGVDNFDTLGSSLGASTTRSAGSFGYTVSSIFAVSGDDSALVRNGTGPDYSLTTAPVAPVKHQSSPGNELYFSDFSSGVNAASLTVGELGGLSTNLIVSIDDERTSIVHPFTTLSDTFVGVISTGTLTDLGVYVRGWPAGMEPVVTSLSLAAPAAAPSVPEPATWAMMLAGFGSVGAAMRRRKARVRFA